MGQQIDVTSQVVGDVALFDTNRSLTGQDGAGFGSAEDAAAGAGFGADLAVRMFESDTRLRHVYVLSNQVTAQRTDGWDDGAVQAAAEVIRDFFVFYREGEEAATPDVVEDPAPA